MKDYIEEEEWENFQPPHSLPPDISGKLWDTINKNTTAPSVRHSYFRWMAVAASVLAVISLSWFFIVKEQKAGGTDVATVAGIKHIFNHTTQKMALTLSDGSTVELLPNSTLSYAEHFTPAKREVLLKGEATFTIAKDAVRPFSVHSDAVVVTVLGTRFTVNTQGANDAEKVILHEGKVMVKIADKAEYYLTPGDVFLYRRKNKRLPDSNTAPLSADIPTDSLSARIVHLEKDKDDCYVFNNAPLDIVFDQLQVIYNAKIIYSNAELGNRTFIGRIDKRDSLPHILKSIALLDNFGLHKQGDSFIIGRSTPY